MKYILTPQQIDKHFNVALWILFLGNIGILVGALMHTVTHSYIVMDVSFFIEILVGGIFLISINEPIWQEKIGSMQEMATYQMAQKMKDKK